MNETRKAVEVQVRQCYSKEIHLPHIFHKRCRAVESSDSSLFFAYYWCEGRESVEVGQ